MALAPAWALSTHHWLPSNADATQRLQASEYHQLGVAGDLWRQQRYEDAVSKLVEAVEINPTHLLIRYSIAQLHYEAALAAEANSPQQAQRFLQAKTEFERLSSLSPDLALAAAFKLGRIAQLQGNSHLAEQHYQAALAISPQQPALYLSLATLYDEQQRMAEAIAAYEKAIALAPDQPHAYNNLALLYERSKRHVEAEACYVKALKVAPGYHIARLNLGTLYAEMGRYQAAREVFNAVITKDPNNPWAHLYLGNLFFQAGAWEAAAQSYTRAIAHQPAFATTYYLLALTLHRLNRTEEAITAGLQYLEHSPEGGLAEEMKSLLAQLKLRHASRQATEWKPSPRTDDTATRPASH